MAYRPLIVWWLKFRKLLEYTDKEKTLHPWLSEREVKEAGRLVRRRGIPYWIMVILSRSLDISKNELARYFTSCLDSTFRLWLAEVRLCSFSARTYLYRIFKLKEGCTPTEWREKMAENVASEGKKQD